MLQLAACYFRHLKPAKSSGYYRVTIAESSDTSNSHRVLVHHLAVFCASNGSTSFQSFPETNDWEEVSHLCNNKACITPEHLHVEQHSVNLTRLCCAMFLGKKEGYMCPHSPACLVSVPK